MKKVNYIVWIQSISVVLFVVLLNAFVHYRFQGMGDPAHYPLIQAGLVFIGLGIAFECSRNLKRYNCLHLKRSLLIFTLILIILNFIPPQFYDRWNLDDFPILRWIVLPISQPEGRGILGMVTGALIVQSIFGMKKKPE